MRNGKIMKMIEKGSLTKLNDGRVVKILNTPNTFMANNSYEVVVWVEDTGLGAVGDSFWIKENEIRYEINSEFMDNIDNYFEFIWDKEGLHIVPKNIDLIKVEADGDDLKKVVISFPNNKHKSVTMYVGNTSIIDNDELCETPPPPTLKEKINKIINGDEE